MGCFSAGSLRTWSSMPGTIYETVVAGGWREFHIYEPALKFKSYRYIESHLMVFRLSINNSCQSQSTRRRHHSQLGRRSSPGYAEICPPSNDVAGVTTVRSPRGWVWFLLTAPRLQFHVGYTRRSPRRNGLCISSVGCCYPWHAVAIHGTLLLEC